MVLVGCLHSEFLCAQLFIARNLITSSAVMVNSKKYLTNTTVPLILTSDKSRIIHILFLFLEKHFIIVFLLYVIGDKWSRFESNHFGTLIWSIHLDVNLLGYIKGGCGCN